MNAKSNHKYARIDVSAPEIHIAASVFIGVLTGVSVCIILLSNTPPANVCMPRAHAPLLAVELGALVNSLYPSKLLNCQFGLGV